MCVIFDGAAHEGMAFAVVLRTVKHWKIFQRLVKVSLLVGSLHGQNVCAELTTAGMHSPILYRCLVFQP